MLLFMLWAQLSFAQTAPATIEIQGRILEKGTQNILRETPVFILPAKVKVMTDAQGFFKTSVPDQEDVEIIVNLSGYKKFQKTFKPESVPAKIYIEKESYNVFETTVSDLRSKKDDSQKSLTQKEFLQAPGANGDPVKAVQNLPGVNRPRGGDSRVIIQGSEPEDTKYNIEGHEVPLVFHFGGLSSIVTPEAVQSVDYLSAGYGPEFNRALGGHVGLNVRTPTTDRNHGMAFMDIYNVGGLVEGPLDDTSSYLVSGRYSYVGYVLQKAAEKNDNLNLTAAPVFFDINAQYAKKLNERDQLRIFSILSNDSLELVSKKPLGNDPRLRGNFEQKTEFYRIIPQWSRQVDENTKVSASLGFGKNRLFADISSNYFDLNSHSLSVRGEIEKKLSPLWTSHAGVDNIYNWYSVRVKIPSTYSEGGVSNPISTGQQQEADVTGKNQVLGLFWRNEFKTAQESPWTFLPHLRVDRYPTTQENLVHPRWGVRYAWDESLSLKALFGTYSQLPPERATDKTFGNPDLKSRKATHYALGFEKDFRQGQRDGWSTSGTLFYKDLQDLVVNSSQWITRDGQLTPENYNNKGTGHIVGFESQIKYRWEDWNLVGSYTYLQSRRKQPGQTELPSPYDQTHSLNLLASYQTEKWNYGSRLRYTTGNPYTPIIGGVYDADNDVYLPQRGDLYSARQEAFFQVDVRIDRKWVYDTWILSAYLDIQNLTNQANQEGLNYAYDYSTSQKISGLPLLPTLGVKGEF